MNHTTRVTLLLLAFLFIVPTWQAQTQLPNTPAANQAKAWLDAFNAGDADKYKEFVTNNFPTHLQRVERDVRFREMTGGFELKKVEETTPTKVVALLQERLSDQIGRMTIEVEAAEPYKITRLSLSAIERPAELTLPHLSESELIPAFRKKLE